MLRVEDPEATSMVTESHYKYYYYLFNAQNDVIGLVDRDGNKVVSYVYNSWGAPLTTADSSGMDIAGLNPFRYRCYCYDEETAFYYLKSRYYDPWVGRFINADRLFNNENLLGNNLYVYCFDNSVVYTDSDGTCPYNGTAADFKRLEQGLPSLECTCNEIKETSKIKPNMRPNPNKRKGSENRQPSGARERNVGHPNAEEHSRVPKGNRGKRFEAFIGLTVITLVMAAIVIDDISVVGTSDNVALIPASAIWWDYAQMLFK